jgi:hypothetical protein
MAQTSCAPSFIEEWRTAGRRQAEAERRWVMTAIRQGRLGELLPAGQSVGLIRDIVPQPRLSAASSQRQREAEGYGETVGILGSRCLLHASRGSTGEGHRKITQSGVSHAKDRAWKAVPVRASSGVTRSGHREKDPGRGPYA